MLDIFINVVLLLTAVGGAALSFFGKPWKDPNAEKKDITFHGVATIVLWFVALGFGVTKEWRTKKNSDQQKGETQKAQKDLIEQQHRFELNQSVEQLQLQKSESSAEKANALLAEMRLRVGKVQSDVTTGNEEAARRSSASLITALADSDQKVREVGIDLPFTSKVHRASTFVGALLPDFSRDECKRNVGIIINTSLTSDWSYLDYLSVRDSTLIHQSPQRDPIVAAEFYSIAGNGPLREEFEGINYGIGQSSWNGNYIEEEIKLSTSRQSAAAIVSSLTSGEVSPIILQTQWPAEAIFLDSGVPFTPSKMPRECAEEIQRHFTTAFEKAALTLVLDQKQNQVIIFPLKVRRPQALPDGNWLVSFGLSGPPRIAAAPTIASRFTVEGTKTQ